MTISFTHIHLMVFELGNEILIIYQTFWNNLSVVTKMGELCEVCDVCDDVVGEELAPFVATLKAFSKVIHACFGKEADPNYREIISDFENCWFDMFVEFDIAFNNKAHIIKRWRRQPNQNFKLSGSGTKFWMLRVNSMVKVY